MTVAQTIEVKQAGTSEEDGAPLVVIAGPGETSGGETGVWQNSRG